MFATTLKFTSDLRHSFRLRQFQNAYFSVTCIKDSVVPSNLKGKSKSSQEWLTRQLRDPYVEKAKMMNYRCRSAFKLIEIDDRFKILSPGKCVLDIGAAPGSWSQVAAVRTNSNKNDSRKPIGKVIAIDLQNIYPIDGVICCAGLNFTHLSSQEELLKIIGDAKVNVVLSDMAPKASGVSELDHDNIIHLAYTALRFSASVTHVGGTFLVKLWSGRDLLTFKNDLSKFYEHVKPVKPKSSRSDSAEIFLLATNFKGLQ